MDTYTIVKDRILNNARQLDMGLYDRLINNPAMLNELIQKGMTQCMQPIMLPVAQAFVPPPNVDLPSHNQMINTFHMFQMMHQMGLIDINKKISAVNDSLIELPNGNKIVSLGNNKYGLIKKKN